MCFPFRRKKTIAVILAKETSVLFIEQTVMCPVMTFQVIDGLQGPVWSQKLISPSDTVAPLVYASTLCDICTMTKSPRDTFLRTYLVAKQHMMVCCPESCLS